MLLHYFPRSHSSALIPTQECFSPSWDSAVLDWHGKSSGIAKEHGNARVFSLHSFRALCENRWGKEADEGDSLSPRSPHRDHERGNSAGPITDVSARSPWLRLWKGSDSPKPAGSGTVPLKDPTTLPKHQGITGTRPGSTGRNEGHPSFSRKTSLFMWKSHRWAVFPQHWGCQ